LTSQRGLSYKMSMQGGSWFCIAGSGAGLIKRPATFPRPAYRLRLLREPHSGLLLWRHPPVWLVCAFTSGAEHKDPRGFLLHRRMIGSQKPSKKRPKNLGSNRLKLLSILLVSRHPSLN